VVFDVVSVYYSNSSSSFSTEILTISQRPLCNFSVIFPMVVAHVPRRYQQFLSAAFTSFQCCSPFTVAQTLLRNQTSFRSLRAIPVLFSDYSRTDVFETLTISQRPSHRFSIIFRFQLLRCFGKTKDLSAAFASYHCCSPTTVAQMLRRCYKLAIAIPKISAVRVSVSSICAEQ
jgi:hypothetical protein